MDAQELTYLFVFLSFSLYIGIAIWSRAGSTNEFYVAGGGVHPIANGMATAADWMSAASFISMAGIIAFMGYDGAVYLMGWTGGYVILALLLAPYLRKFGCYTVPDFIGTRYGGNLARFCAIVVLVVASFTYVTAQINATGTVAARALQIPFEYGVWFGLVGILLCSMLGGMRAVTWTQVAQYIVLIIAYLVRVIWMSNKQDFGLTPQFVNGDAVARVAELEVMHLVGSLLQPQSVSGLKALTVPHSTVAECGLAA